MTLSPSSFAHVVFVLPVLRLSGAERVVVELVRNLDQANAELRAFAYSLAHDLRFLREKIDNGASFLITQLFFDNELYFRFVEEARAVGIDAPIVPGIMPITDAKQIKTITGICWYDTAGPRAVQIVLVRDPKGEWRDEALVCTDVRLSAAEVITGYCRRWSVEVAIGDAKGQMGFHDPCVWKKESVQRAAPMAWFTGTLVMLWYAREGRHHCL